MNGGKSIKDHIGYGGGVNMNTIIWLILSNNNAQVQTLEIRIWWCKNVFFISIINVKI